MKYFIISFFVVIQITSNCFGQEEFKLIDTAKIVCFYDYSFQEDSSNIKSINKEQMILQIGKHFSKFAPINKVFRDSVFNYTKMEGGPDIALRSFSIAKGHVNSFLCDYNIYTTLSNTHQIKFIGNTLPKGCYIYEQNVNIKWTLLNNKDTIINKLPCKMAKTTFAGRAYTAYYSLKIPTKVGPYKFHGLPGLIVLLKDSNSEHVFKLNSVSPILKQEMFEYNFSKNIIVSPAKFRKAFFTDVAMLCKSLSQGVIIKNPEADKTSRVIKVLMAKNNFIEKY